ncbi:MAG TPA: LPS-assembly protein LptD [Ottowia sp.]|uniref:LPS-assembly protein LptD n=1 Tax=Ottowia sp. TaxID=1898956 RepID=UPI002C0514F7|nr:LPS-assembly protein LptD [Ottowia sp.]HMN21683.1 LPS-assembly protein LptD [Ottowia sp.]
MRLRSPPLSRRPAGRPSLAPLTRALAAGLLSACGATAALAQPDAALVLRATPMLSEAVPVQGESPTFVRGDRIEGRAGLETTIEGHAELRRPGLVLRADRLSHDERTNRARAQGDVRVNLKGNRYGGTEGELQLDAFEGFLLRPTYRLLATGAHGEAERIDFRDADHATVHQGSYTTCPRPGPDWVPDWILRADRLDLDQEEDEGRAQGAVLEFKGVPILPVPALSFPLGEQRKSGWLPPTVGLDSKSGLELSLPWYWNIAPNRDATFTPTVMSRRGVDLGGEFRYLEGNYQGRVNASVMPDDRLRQRTRWSLFARHNGSHDTGFDAIGALGLGLNLNRVSDNDYWRDFTRRGEPLTTRLLANDGALSWARGDFSANVRALKWQTLQDPGAPIVPPYDRLPQVTGRWAHTSTHGLDYAVDGEYTRFRGDPFWTHQPDADRSLLHAQLAYPWVRPWGFLTPRLQLHATHYQFDRPLADGATTASRVLPTFSLDGGLVFERPTRFFGRAFTQTLEPRLKYIATPYRDQSRLPLYDTGAYDFNFATIWSENAFAGNDRIADNHLVTAGLTSRLIDPATGAEALRLSVAQRYRFAPQKVVLPGSLAEGRGLSDVMLGAGVNWDPRWAFSTVVQYNLETRRSTRTTIDARYSPERYHTVSAAYRRQRDVRNESIDLGWQWPLADLLGRRAELGTTRRAAGGSCSGRWYGVGRLNYSLSERRLVEGLVGFEYDAGCWIGRVVVEKLNSSYSSSTKRIMFQLEFIGLSRLGTNSLRTLRNSIPHYQMLREEVTPPSRFTEYE